MNLREIVEEIEQEEETRGSLGAALQDCERKLSALRAQAAKALGRSLGKTGDTQGGTVRPLVQALASGPKTVDELSKAIGKNHHAVMAAIYYQTRRKDGSVRWADRDRYLVELVPKKGKK